MTYQDCSGRASVRTRALCRTTHPRPLLDPRAPPRSPGMYPAASRSRATCAPAAGRGRRRGCGRWRSVKPALGRCCRPRPARWPAGTRTAGPPCTLRAAAPLRTCNEGGGAMPRLLAIKKCPHQQTPCRVEAARENRLGEWWGCCAGPCAPLKNAQGPMNKGKNKKKRQTTSLQDVGFVLGSNADCGTGC